MLKRFLGLWALAGGLFAGDLSEGLQFYDLKTGRPMKVGPVTAETVEGFELLYATPGTGDIAEIAGHLLLRVKVGSEPGDSSRDLVVSFLAATPEAPLLAVDPEQAPDCRSRNWFNLVQAPGAEGSEPPLVSLWQSILGLTGGFPVVMDIQTLEHTLKTYTVEQDRSLRRYALVLTPEEKAGLVNRLYRYPREEPPSYFFFSQNCGSVLVRVVGEGMGDPVSSEFAPSISPPHTLIALLLREGRLRPVMPDFHSFRDRGRLYRKPLRGKIHELQSMYPDAGWPRTGDLMHPDAAVRLRAVETLRALGWARSELDPELYPLASLLQETETVFDPKDRFCRDTTGPVTAEIRRWQREMLVRSGEGIAAALPPQPPGPERVGVDHTGLYPIRLTSGWRDRRDKEEMVVHLSVAGLRQQMGSPSRVAMQRGGAVELFGLDLTAGEDGLDTLDWTGLELHKFREGLGHVASGPWNGRAWGMGLRVLNEAWRKDTDVWQGTAAGISALLNLGSTDSFDSHLYLAAGVDAGHRNSDWGLRMPVELHALHTVGKTRIRMQGTWTRSWIQGEADFWEAGLGLSHPVAEWGGAEVKALVAYKVEENDHDLTHTLTLGVEILRF